MRIVIFANGEFKYPELVRSLIQPDDFLIAADGGLNHIKSIGLKPDLVIGDFDSINNDEVLRLDEQVIEIKRFPVEKNQIDLELAIEEAITRGGDPILITSATGGRLDLTLANVMCLLDSRLAQIDIRLDDGFEEVFLIRQYASIEGNPGDIVSLLAVNGAVQGIRTEGLRYPLINEALYPEQSRGVSNVMLAQQARIWVKDGFLLCIHTRTGLENEKR